MGSIGAAGTSGAGATSSSTSYDQAALWCRFAAAALGLGSLAAAMVSTELYVRAGYEPTHPAYAGWKLATTLACVALVAVVVIKYIVAFQSLVALGILHRKEGFFSRPQSLRVLALEVVLCGLHMPVGLHGTWISGSDTTSVMQSLDGTLTVLMLLRLYLLLPVVADAFRFNSTLAAMIAKWNDVRFDTSFTLRAAFSEHPLPTLSVYLVTSLLVIAYALRNFERGVCSSPTIVAASFCDTLQLNDFERYDVALWSAVITALTVGYGDVFPITPLGRVTAAAAAITGVVLIALLVATVTTRVELDPAERRALEALRKHQLKLARRAIAAKLVVEALRENVRRAVKRRRSGRLPSTETLVDVARRAPLARRASVTSVLSAAGGMPMPSHTAGSSSTHMMANPIVHATASGVASGAVDDRGRSHALDGSQESTRSGCWPCLNDRPATRNPSTSSDAAHAHGRVLHRARLVTALRQWREHSQAASSVERKDGMATVLMHIMELESQLAAITTKLDRDGAGLAAAAGAAGPAATDRLGSLEAKIDALLMAMARSEPTASPSGSTSARASVRRVPTHASRNSRAVAMTPGAGIGLPDGTGPAASRGGAGAGSPDAAAGAISFTRANSRGASILVTAPVLPPATPTTLRTPSLHAGSVGSVSSVSVAGAYR